MAARIILHCFKSASLSSRHTRLIASNSIVSSMLLSRMNSQAHLSLLRKFSSAESEESEAPEDVQPAVRDPAKDRSHKVPVEVSISYMKSKAYETTYGKDPVWKKYGRNYKGHWAPDTRKTCVRQDMISTGNPCPVCRDEYLVLDHRNVNLLKQFISPFNGEILPTKKTGLCQTKHRELLIAISKAKDYGLVSFDIPTRDYDYSEYRKK